MRFKPTQKLTVTRTLSSGDNWAYMDSFEHDVELRTFWVFMLWRLQSHGSVDQLIVEVSTAFPDLLRQLIPEEFFSPTKLLHLLIEIRFIEHFLQFWGFVVADPKRIFDKEPIPRKVSIQPLLTHTFHFSIKVR